MKNGHARMISCAILVVAGALFAQIADGGFIALCVAGPPLIVVIIEVVRAFREDREASV